MKKLIYPTLFFILLSSCKKECEDCYVINGKSYQNGQYKVWAYRECGEGQMEFFDANSYNQYELGDYVKGTGCKYE